MNPEIAKCLVLSTAHLTRTTAKEMDSVGEIGLPCYDLEYGYLVILPDPKEPLGPEIPPELAAVVRRARELGCDWVRFDCDADTLPDLPVFDW